MSGPSADRNTEWEGSSLGDLVSALQAQALPVRIEVIAPGAGASIAGEVHLLAGGLSDAFAGSLRRDDAMAALQRLEGARFLVECRLPHPESGSIEKPGPKQGSLKERPLAALMRYCEDYVLSCKLEVRRGGEHATIEYRRGEIASAVVDGVDGSERLPEVMAWSEGSYEIVLPTPTLPPVTTPRKREVPTAARPTTEGGPKVEPKRHSTLPMMTTPTAAATAAPAPDAAAQARPAAALPPAPSWRPTQPLANPLAQKPPVQVQASPLAPRTFAQQAATPAQKPAPQPIATAPTQKPPVQTPPATPAHKPAVEPQASPPAQRPPTQRLASVLAKKPLAQPPAGPLAQKTPLARITPVPVTPPPIAVTPGAPPAPAAARAVQPTAKSIAEAVAEAVMATPAGVPPASPMMAEETARGTPPFPATPVAPPARQPPPGGRPAAPAKPAGAQAKPALPGPEPLAPLPPAQPAGSPGKSSELPVQPARPTHVASNDLKPKSGTIEARPLHANHLPAHAAPIELAENPMAEDQPGEPTSPLDGTTSLAHARARRKGRRERPMLTYVVVGLAVGMAAVLVYWAYLHLPFGHR